MEIPQEHLQVALLSFFLVYFTCIPELVYNAVRRVLDWLPIRLMYLVLVATATHFDPKLGILMALAYVVTFHNCAHFEFFNVPDVVRPYLDLRPGKAWYPDGSVSDVVHNFILQRDGCYRDCTADESQANIRPVCSAACDVDADKHFKSSPGGVQDVQNATGVSEADARQALRDIGCSRLAGNNLATWKNDRCARL
jgi:hypothetical protein